VLQYAVSAAELLCLASGFCPSSVYNSPEGKSATPQRDRALMARHSALVEQFAMAAAREDIAKFNGKNPHLRI
jgi:hypothetical protein